MLRFKVNTVTVSLPGSVVKLLNWRVILWSSETSIFQTQSTLLS